jgi:hypothetical protein
MPQTEVPLAKRSYTQADLDRAVSEARLRCARWLIYTDSAREDVWRDILYSDLSMADTDPDVDIEMMGLNQSQEPR